MVLLIDIRKTWRPWASCLLLAEYNKWFWQAQRVTCAWEETLVTHRRCHICFRRMEEGWKQVPWSNMLPNG